MFSKKKKEDDPAVLHPSQNDDSRVVVIPIDESQHAETAFDWYVENAKKENDVLKIVHCMDIVPEAEYHPHGYMSFRNTRYMKNVRKGTDKLKLVHCYEPPPPPASSYPAFRTTNRYMQNMHQTRDHVRLVHCVDPPSLLPPTASYPAFRVAKRYLKNSRLPQDKVKVVHCADINQPISHSSSAGHGLSRYLKNQRKPNDKVKLVHCAELEQPSGAYYPDYAVPPEAWQDQIEKSKDRVHKLMEKYEKKMKDSKVSGSVYSEMGRAGECVCKVADKSNANLIIMGSRGLGMVRRTVMGSCSEYVLHHSKVPVTIIPKEDPNKYI